MSNVKIEAKWGIILGLVTFVVFFLSKILGWQTAATFDKHLSIAFGAFLIGNLGCLFLGLKEKREKDLGGVMTYIQGIKSGAIITVIAAIMGSLLLFVFANFLNPNFLPAMTEFSISKGEMEAGQVMTITAFLSQFFTHSLIIGIVFSAIVAFFTKKTA